MAKLLYNISTGALVTVSEQELTNILSHLDSLGVVKRVNYETGFSVKLTIEAVEHYMHVVKHTRQTGFGVSVNCRNPTAVNMIKFINHVLDQTLPGVYS